MSAGNFASTSSKPPNYQHRGSNSYSGNMTGINPLAANTEISYKEVNDTNPVLSE